MTKEGMIELAEEMQDNYAVVKQYVKITNHGELKSLRALFKEAFGLCDDTARQRVNYLLDSKIISRMGLLWKYNESGCTDFEKQVNLLKSIKNSGVPDEKPKDAFESSYDKANRERYRAKQE